MNSHLLKSKSVFLMSLLFAIFLNIKCLNAIIISFNNVLVGSIMSYLYIVVFGALTLTAIFYKKRLLSGISFKSFVVLSYILCLWLISLFLYV